MKRYFNFPNLKQVVKIEFEPTSIVRTLSIPELFDNIDATIVEITKREFIALSCKYKKENETNLSMSIER